MFTETTVINIRAARCDVYGGRPGWLGNPFVIGRDGTREEVIIKFAVYFLRRLRFDREFRFRIIHECGGKVLGCSCKPKACHLDVVATWINVRARIIDNEDIPF